MEINIGSKWYRLESWREGSRTGHLLYINDEPWDGREPLPPDVLAWPGVNGQGVADCPGSHPFHGHVWSVVVDSDAPCARVKVFLDGQVYARNPMTLPEPIKSAFLGCMKAAYPSDDVPHYRSDELCDGFFVETHVDARPNNNLWRVRVRYGQDYCDTRLSDGWPREVRREYERQLRAVEKQAKNEEPMKREEFEEKVLELLAAIGDLTNKATYTSDPGESGHYVRARPARRPRDGGGFDYLMEVVILDGDDQVELNLYDVSADVVEQYVSYCARVKWWNEGSEFGESGY